jgi:polysaccharide biosynthesis transport protein
LPAPVRSDSPRFDSQRVMIVATTVAVTTVALTPLLNQAPIYEGSFQMKAEQVTRPGQYGITKPSAQPNVTPPASIDFRSLKGVEVLEPVIQKLQLPHLDVQSLADNLTFTTEGGQTKVTYRDVDPQRVQIVLSQLSQAYVDYGQECQGATCKGIRYIEERIPQVQTQIQKMSAEIETLHQRYGVKNLQAQLNVLNNRTADLSKQEAQLQGKLAESQQTYRQLQQRMALKENEPIALQLLSQDSRYRMLLTQFQTLDRQFAPQFANLESSQSPAVKALQAQHQQITNQLTQQAQFLLQQYLASPAANTQNPVFQNPTQLQLLQQSILVVHSTQMIETRLSTMTAAKQAIDQQRQQMIQLLGQYDQLRQTLDTETQSLQTYFDQLEQLQKISQADVELEITQVPEMVSDRAGQPAAMIPDLQRNLGIGAAVGLLVGVGIAGALDRRRQESAATGLGLGDLPVDVLISKAKGLADLRLREQLQQVA